MCECFYSSPPFHIDGYFLPTGNIEFIFTYIITLDSTYHSERMDRIACVLCGYAFVRLRELFLHVHVHVAQRTHVPPRMVVGKVTFFMSWSNSGLGSSPHGAAPQLSLASLTACCGVKQNTPNQT